MKSPIFNKTFYWDNEDMSWKVQPLPSDEELLAQGIHKFTNKNGDSYYINIGKD